MDILEVSKGLAELGLHGNGITDEGQKLLKGAAWKNRNLCKVKLDDPESEQNQEARNTSRGDRRKNGDVDGMSWKMDGHREEGRARTAKDGSIDRLRDERDE